jgi:hypothetical protein
MKKFLAPLFAVLAMLFGLVAQAQAALPAGVSTAIDGASTDGSTAVGLLAAAGAVVFIIYRVLKRFGIIA